jgi:hypothetical protein
MDFTGNPKEIQDQVGKKYKNLEWPEFSNENFCTGSKKFELNNTQKFVGEYFTPKNPNGMYLFHSVGTGKTLTAINVIKKFQEKGYNAIWVTRTTLRKDLDKSLKMLPVPRPFPVFSYKQFSNIYKGKNENYKALIQKSKNEDPLYKTVLIIDEAHKLFTKDLKPQEMHDIKAIQKLIYNSYSISKESRVRVILMSATPVSKDFTEIINSVNLLIPELSKRLPLDTFDPVAFKEATKGMISYLDLSNDKSKFAKVKYTEVFTDISSPENKEKIDCKGIIKECLKLGHSNATCAEAKKNCLLAKKISDSTKGKTQSEMLKKRCKI